MSRRQRLSVGMVVIACDGGRWQRRGDVVGERERRWWAGEEEKYLGCAGGVSELVGQSCALQFTVHVPWEGLACDN